MKLCSSYLTVVNRGITRFWRRQEWFEKLAGVSLFPLFIAILIGLVGCTPPRTTETPQASPTDVALVVSTATLPPASPTPTLSPTAPLPTATIMPVLKPWQKEKCVSLASMPADLSGKVVLTSNKPFLSYILDLKTGERIDLGVSTEDEIVSPDFSKIIYKNRDSLNIIIANGTGKEMFTFPDPERIYQPYYWLDNERVVLTKRRSSTEDVFTLFSLVIWNITSGEQQELLPDYPDISNDTQMPLWSRKSNILIHPSLNFALYAKKGTSLALWNRETETEISRVYQPEVESIPRWSPDGQFFVTSASPQWATGVGKEVLINFDDGLPSDSSAELLIGDLTGKLQRLTFYAVDDTAVENEGFFAWSPDGKKIAFNLVSYPERSSRLVVYSFETNEATDYCFQSNGEPYWLPDSQQLLVTQLADSYSEAFLVDTTNGLAYSIAKDAEAKGWLEIK